MFAGAVVALWSAWFLEPWKAPREPNIDQVVVYVMLTVLSLCVGYLVVHNMGPPDPYATQDHF